MSSPAAASQKLTPSGDTTSDIAPPSLKSKDYCDHDDPLPTMDPVGQSQDPASSLQAAGQVAGGYSPCKPGSHPTLPILILDDSSHTGSRDLDNSQIGDCGSDGAADSRETASQKGMQADALRTESMLGHADTLETPDNVETEAKSTPCTSQFPVHLQAIPDSEDEGELTSDEEDLSVVPLSLERGRKRTFSQTSRSEEAKGSLQKRQK